MAAFCQRDLAAPRRLVAHRVGVAEPSSDGRCETLIADTASGRRSRALRGAAPAGLRIGPL